MDKIQELTSKLYSEGVEKGREEADKIVAAAYSQREQILKEAKENANEIITMAKKEAAELKEHTEAELKLYASQSSAALKSEITNLVTNKLATMNVKAATADTTFMQQLIVEIVNNWAEKGKLTVGVADAVALESYIASNAKQLLDEGLKIESVNGIDTGFILSPADGSYKVKFGEAEFIAYFKEFLRPTIQKLLF
jgi:V/A-type H+-transporting ATPase subunit E